MIPIPPRTWFNATARTIAVSVKSLFLHPTAYKYVRVKLSAPVIPLSFTIYNFHFKFYHIALFLASLWPACFSMSSMKQSTYYQVTCRIDKQRESADSPTGGGSVRQGRHSCAFFIGCVAGDELKVHDVQHQQWKVSYWNFTITYAAKADANSIYNFVVLAEPLVHHKD